MVWQFSKTRLPTRHGNPSGSSPALTDSPQLGETRSGKILRSPIWFIVDRVEIDQDTVSPASLEAGAKDY